MATPLLLHFDGADASTSVVDEYGRTVSVIGNAQLDTDWSKWGGSALLLDGSGDCVRLADSADWAPGNGEFVCSFWLRPASVSADKILVDKRTSTAVHAPYNCYLGAGGVLNLLASTTGSSWTQSIASGGGALAVNTEAYVEFGRAGNTLYLWLNGAAVGSVAISSALASNSATLNIGASGDAGLSLNGWVEEFYFRVGEPPHTSAYTPPTAPRLVQGDSISALGLGGESPAIAERIADSVSALGLGGEFPAGVEADSVSALGLGGEFPAIAERVADSVSALDLGATHPAIPIYVLTLPLRQRVQSHVTLPLRQRVQPLVHVLTLPLRQRVGIRGTLTLPLRQRVQPPSYVLALPLRQRVATTGALTLPLRQRARTDTGIFTGAGSQHLAPRVTLGGVDVSAVLVGSLEVDREEGRAAVAEFTVRPFAGPIDLVTWLGAAVEISVSINGAAPELLFTGTVSDPSYDPRTRLTTFACSDDLQATLDGLPPTIVDLVAGGYWSAALFGADATGWQRAQDRLSTIPEVLDRAPAGGLRRTPWLAKATPDWTFAADGIIDGSLRAEPGPWREQINRIDLEVELRYQRRLHREQGYRWVYPGGFHAYIADSSTMPTEDDIRRAATGAGWQLVSEHFVRFPSTGAYNGRPWVHNPALPPFFVTEATLRVARRWAETITETYRYAVTAPASITRFGEQARTEYASLAPEPPDIAWAEVQLPLRGGGLGGPTDLAGASTAPSGDRYFDDLDSATADGALVAALARAQTTILAAHRANSVQVDLPLLPALDLVHTARIETDTVTAQGKVRQVVHRIDLSDAPRAITTARLAVSQADNVAVTASPLVAPPRLATAPVPVPGLLLASGDDQTHLGGRWYSPQPQDPDWTGWVGNYGSPSPWNTPLYDESFSIDWGEIDRTPVAAERAIPHVVAIPHETLEIAA